MGGIVLRVSPFKPCARIATILAALLTIQSCRSEQTPPSVVPAETAARMTGSSAAPPTAAQTSAAPVTQSSWSPSALEELLAPIALYPDQLLAQVLAASINSQEVLDGGNWLLQNQNLKGKELDAAAENVGFGPAMRALVQFPTVVDMMCQEIDWTKQVGSAFSSDQKSVLDAVQRLRKQAADIGNLKSTPQQTVATKSEGGNVYVEVKPADPQVVYVPQYDAETVYTTPAPQATTTTTVITEEDDDDGGDALVGGLIGFGVGMVVGSLFHDDYYYPNWGYGGMYYGGRPFYPPAYAYRPVYGGGFNRANAYVSPRGYRNSYNSPGSNNNIVINNNNFNRFKNNQNLRDGSARSPLAEAERPGQRPGVDTRPGQRPGVDTRPAKDQNWKGQSTYAGAKDRGAGIRNQDSDRRPGSTTREARPGNSSVARPSAGTREAASRVDRGSADRRASNTNRVADRQQQHESSQTRTGRADRGYDKTARPSATHQPDRVGLSQPSARTADRSSHSRSGAFSGAESKGSGNFERSASARGNASAGSRQVSSRPAGSRSAPRSR